jgi:hypothetical protein
MSKTAVAGRVVTKRIVAPLMAAALVAGAVVALAASPASASPTGPLPKVNDGMVKAFATVGDTVYVGGTFSTLTMPDGTLVSQPRLFAYDLATGAFDTGFRPTLNGEVTSLAATASGDVIVGGGFTSVNGTKRQRLVKLSDTGVVDTAFVANANNKVQALTLNGNRLFVGGVFSKIKGKARSMLAELDANTGKVATGFDVPLTGTAATGGFEGVQALDVSPAGDRLLVIHTALQLGGLDRMAIGIVDVSGATATVDPWSTDLWSENLVRNGGVVRITNGAWGPDGTWFVTTNTGGDRAPTNDVVQRFDLDVPLPAQPTWLTRQFDSGYAVDVGPDGTVYVGGHFRYTEAPGSVDPYPGDPAVNYGFGTTGGARVLGDQVVARMQLAALDPETGKALNWYGTADGQHGVTALKVTGSQLLVGHDGQKVGGLPTGAHGVLDAYGAPWDTTKPHSTVETPLMGQVMPVGVTHVSGTATAPAGVRKVLVEVRPTGVASSWLRPDGTLGTYYAYEAALESPDATSTSWSLDLDLPDHGDFSLWVKAQDVNKVNEPVKYEVPVQTNDPSNPPPDVTWTSPTAGQNNFTSNTITVSGTATDPDGVAAIRLSFYNRDANGYVMEDGSLGDWTGYDAVLSEVGGTTVTWSYTITLPNGEYRAFADSVDTLGSAPPHGVAHNFIMSPNNPAPTVTLDSPLTGSLVGSDVTLSGVAADDSDVSRVYVRLSDTRFSRGPQIAGSFGSPAWLPAELSNQNATSSAWTITVPNLPQGSYTATVYAEDGGGVVTPTDARPQITIHRRATLAEPQTAITGPAASSFRPSELAIPLTGTASATDGVREVQLVLRDTAAAKWLQEDGTAGNIPGFFTVPVASPGAASTTWSTTVSVPYASSWRVDALAVGDDGTMDWTSSGARTTYLVYPGDADPTFSTYSPVTGATFSGGVISAAGRALDDTGVSKVQLLLVRTSDNKGLRTDGTIGTAQWVDALLTNPNQAPGTNWTYVSPKLTTGTWKVSFRATDSVGKVMLTYPTSTVTVTG